jgi:DNA-binding NarL/FixJ family response regulator
VRNNQTLKRSNTQTFKQLSKLRAQQSNNQTFQHSNIKKNRPMSPSFTQQASTVIKIVIADDHPMFSQGLANIITDAGRESLEISTIVDSGEKVIQALRRYRPQLLLMDMNMPGKDGLDVLKEIKGQFRDLKVIILTTYNDANLAKEVLREGANGYILKTADSATIFKGIEEVLDNGTYISDEVEVTRSAPKENPVVNSRFTDKLTRDIYDSKNNS